jgi:hypothetical protein
VALNRAGQAQPRYLGTGLSLVEFFSGDQLVATEIPYMPFLKGFLLGALLAVIALFVIDHVKVSSETSASEPQKIVNWDRG